MARSKGLLGISANFEPQIAAALDARDSVPTKAELYLTATWTANDGGIYTYVSMKTVVWNDGTNNGMYILTGADYTNPVNWIKLGSGGSGGVTGGLAFSITLLASGWVTNQQTLTAAGVTLFNTVLVSGGENRANLLAYSAAGISCIDQGVNSLTFECTTAPSIDLMVNIEVLDNTTVNILGSWRTYSDVNGYYVDYFNGTTWINKSTVTI